MTIAVRLVPLMLVIVAEGAWLSVVGGLLQEFALRRTAIGLPIVATFVASGTLMSFVLVPRLGDRWPIVALGIAAGAAAIGWALSDEARVATGAGIGPALAAHPGGLICGLAVVRGYAHARLPLAEDTVAHLLSLGIPGLALVGVIGGLIREPLRSAFLGEALTSSIVFVAAAALALAFARLDDVGQDGGFDWRRNPPWLLLAILVLVFAIAAAVPLAAAAGTIVSVLISLALGPLLVFGLASGFDRTARRAFIFMGLAFVVVYALANRGIGISPSQLDVPAATGSTSPANEQVIAASLGGLLVVAGLIALVVLIALWMRRTPPLEPGVDETRSIDRGGLAEGPARRRGRFGRRIEPTTAVEAYVALVDELEGRPDVRREPGETPAIHAARLRPTGRGGLALDLLAADYALARYGGETLSAAEDRRGVSRWKRLRRTLAHGPRPSLGATGADAAVPQAEIDATEGTRTGLRAG